MPLLNRALCRHTVRKVNATMKKNNLSAKTSNGILLGIFLLAQTSSAFLFTVRNPGTTYYLSQFPTVKDAFDAAAGGNTLVIDEDRIADTATGTLTGLWNDLTIRSVNGHRIRGQVIFEGQAVKKVITPVFTNSDNAWLPVGTTNITLSPLPPPHSKLVMETSLQAAWTNQCGIEFIRVVSTNGTHILLDTDLYKTGYQGLTTAFYNPKLCYYAGRQSPDSLARGSTFMPGNWTDYFKPGDIARIENNSFLDTPDATKHYFENVEVLSIDEQGFSFEPVSSAFGTPYVAQTAFGHDLTIEASDFQVLKIRNYRNIRIDTFTTEYLRLYNCNNLDIRNVTASSIQFSILASFSHCKDAYVETIQATGGVSSYDNAAIKFMSPINFTVTNLSAAETMSTGSGRIEASVMTDYDYTPYKTWGSNNSFSNITGDKPGGIGLPVSLWFAGLRDSVIQDIHSGGGDTRIHRMDNVCLAGSNTCGRITDFMRTENSVFDFGSSAYAKIYHCSTSEFSGHVSGGKIEGELLLYDGRNVFVHGTTDRYCTNNILSNLHSSSTNRDIFIWLSQVNGIQIEECSDRPRPDGSWSVHKGNDVTGATLTNNSFHASTAGL